MGCSSDDPSDTPSTVTGLDIPFDSLSDYQQAIFVDGTVSFAEYEQAIFDQVECLRSEGIVATDPELDGNNFYAYSTRNPPEETADEFSEIMANCFDEHLSAVEFGYADSATPSEEESDQFYEEVVACVRSNGVEVDDASTSSLNRLILEEPDLYESCFAEAANDGP